jgi:hypothetical protein
VPILEEVHNHTLLQQDFAPLHFHTAITEGVLGSEVSVEMNGQKRAT